MKALELAKELDAVPENGADPELIQDAAAELRRLVVVEAELERIKELEPVAWANPYGLGSISDYYMKNFATGLERQTYTVQLYALGSKTA